MIGILGSNWTPRCLSWSIQVLFCPGYPSATSKQAASRYWIESSICDNLKHQKRCSEILFFLEFIKSLHVALVKYLCFPSFLSGEYQMIYFFLEIGYPKCQISTIDSINQSIIFVTQVCRSRISVVLKAELVLSVGDWHFLENPQMSVSHLQDETPWTWRSAKYILLNSKHIVISSV